ncbi:uncharacterized protein LOC144054774 [Vanacampus margaritifer]
MTSLNGDGAGGRRHPLPVHHHQRPPGKTCLSAADGQGPTVAVPRAPDACSGDSIVCVSKDLPAALFRHVFIMLIQPETEAGRRERGTIAPQIEESRCYNTKGQRRYHLTSRRGRHGPLARQGDGGRTGDLNISGQVSVLRFTSSPLDLFTPKSLNADVTAPFQPPSLRLTEYAKFWSPKKGEKENLRPQHPGLVIEK